MVNGVEITGDPNFRPQIPIPEARFTAKRRQKAAALLEQRSQRPISDKQRKQAVKVARKVTKVSAKPKEENIPEVPQWAKDYRSPKPETSKVKANPIKSEYDPETAVSKSGSGMWWVKTVEGGDFPTPFKTKREGIERARLHKEMVSAPAPAKRENEPPPSPPKPRFEPRKVYATNTQLPSSMGGMKKGYVAEIKGTHPKYKLDRQFLQGRNDGAGTEYTITQRGIYETQTEESKGRAMRTYVFHGRKKTRELLPPGGYSSPTMPSVDRAVNLLELFRKKR